MLLIFACILAAVAAAPFYDQRQDGEENIQADIKNILVVFAYPKAGNLAVMEILDALTGKSKKIGNEPIAQDRADVHAMEAFVEPNTPYRVVIGPTHEKPIEVDGGNAIVIAGRRRLETEPGSDEEMKLLGATEQCGPEWKRDPITLICQPFGTVLETVDEAPEKTPEVITVKT